MTFLVEHVYWSRYDKPPLAARCCHVANELTDFTGDRQINEQTEGHCHCIKQEEKRSIIGEGSQWESGLSTERMSIEKHLETGVTM